jgi:predicted peptidase
MQQIFSYFLIVICSFSSFAQEVKEKFTTENTQIISFGYILHKPISNKGKKPLLIFLHGSGEKGIDLEKVKVHGPLKYIQTNTLDAYILAPQCPENQYWESESLHKLIQKIISENPIDSNRVYLTGLSMGAWGAWNLAFAHPRTFAALVPICGFVDRVPMIENCKIAEIPTQIFHGLLDDVVDANYSITIYKKLKNCSNNIQLTLFDDANHDSWTRVYDNRAIYDWMFQQVKK